MSTMASQITSPTIIYSNVFSGADQRKHQSSASLAFVRGTHRWPVNSPHKGPVTRKMFPFDDVIMTRCRWTTTIWALKSQSGWPEKCCHGCAAPVFNRLSLAKEILSKTYPWLRFISWPWAHSYVIFRSSSSNIIFIRENFRKQTLDTLAPKRYFLGVFVKHRSIPLAKDFKIKIHPWQRIFYPKYTLGLRALKFYRLNKISIFNVWLRYFVWEIIFERYDFYTKLKS